MGGNLALCFSLIGLKSLMNLMSLRKFLFYVTYPVFINALLAVNALQSSSSFLKRAS